MEVYVENSCLEGDSNATILPAKKSNKKKGRTQEHEMVKKNKTPPLSKSQKRKLKKLEEEKERALLLSKSIETLEKYKIPEDVFPLLRSSKSISRLETVKEKRRMAVQFSKVGLEVPHGDQPFKRTDGDACCETEVESGRIEPKYFDHNDHLVQMEVEKEVPNCASISLSSCQEPIVGNEAGLDDGPASTFSAEEVSVKDKLNESLILDSGDSGSLPNGPLHRTLAAPTVVHVLRPMEVETKRKDLPIVMMEQEIMEAVNENSTIIVCGETGCGKTTQVPQFLYEAGFGSNLSAHRRGVIGVTQPRRVAVLATSRRVAFELGLHLGREVGFQVRHDKRVGDSCSIKFMTDGILLREVQTDILLKRYSVLILDEAHERSVNTDILIGMLSRIIHLRQKTYEDQQRMILSGQNISPENMIFPLKLILMSATLRVEDFVSGRRLFPNPPPVIEVPTRQFPVTIHFSKRTEIVDYIGQAYKKVLSIHKRLPPGGILVFVTGQREVEYLCQKLRKASQKLVANTDNSTIGNEVTSMSELSSTGDISMKEINEAFEIQENFTDQQTDRFRSDNDNIQDIDDDNDDSDVSDDSETDGELEIVGDIRDLEDQMASNNDGDLVGIFGEKGTLASLKAAFEVLAGKNALDSNSKGKEIPSVPGVCSELMNHGLGKNEGGDKGHPVGVLRVLPLYAMLPAAAQLHVFEEVREGERLVIIATNVAETSLTIPGIKYVVDTGREKVKNYNPSNGVERYEVQWISKASAAQRAGRAGRTGPGHCYRLYSSAIFTNILPDFSFAEISKVPVESIVLILKAMGINKVENFPFPTPPVATALVEAEHCLQTLEALDGMGRLTPLGKAMAYYPLSPRHSRMLLTVIQTLKKAKNYARANLVLGYAVAVAAALSLSNPFLMQFEGSQTNGNDNSLEQDGRSGSQEGRKILDKLEKLKKKKLKETAKTSRAKFCNPSSDAMTVAYTLQCFELCESPVEFCDKYALHLKTLEEMSKLRKQLLQLVFSQNLNYGLEQEFLWIGGTLEDVEQVWRVFPSKSPLLLDEEEILAGAICAGWADRVAKRIRRTFRSSDADGKANAVSYQACMVKETVFLHRWSSLANSAPEFLVYSELLHTKRPYMHGATSVKPEWLVNYAKSLCTLSNVEAPRPYYDPQTDQVFRWVVPTFGPHLWQLPLHSVMITNSIDRVKAFACALLGGHVLPCLRSVREFMEARPSVILDLEAQGERRVGNLVFKLKTRSIDSCAMLREAWKENPRELHSEILSWFKKSFHGNFGALWSRMHEEIQLESQERFPKKVKRHEKKMEISL